MLKQRTLKNPIRATGVGLHTGQKVYMTLRPGKADMGIVFRRTDCTPMKEFRGDAFKVGDTTLATTLVDDGVRVQTVEHLLSAMAGLGIDNAIVELSSDELPIMDGSAGPFVFLIQSAGIQELDAPKKFIRIKRSVQVTEDDKWARFDPVKARLYSWFVTKLRISPPLIKTKCPASSFPRYSCKNRPSA